MEKKYQNLFVILLLTVVQSCGLLSGEDDFSCEKNAPLKQSGKDVCASAVMVDYQQNIDTPSEYVKIRFIHGAGSFNITLNTTEIQPNTIYNYPGEAGLDFAEMNKGGSGTVTITNIDRSKKMISGEYDLSAEGAANYQAYEYQVSGTFTDVAF